MTNEKNLREAPVWKLLCTLSLPMIVIMLVQVLYNMADTFFLGRAGSALQVAAVSLVTPVFGLTSAFNTLIGFGGCTLLSIALGRGELETLRQAPSCVLYSSLGLGLVLGAALLLAGDPLVALLGADAETAGFAAEYLRVLAIGTPLSVTSGALGNILRADGESKGPVVAMLAGTGLNILLDPLFISVLGWGVAGAAWATVVGNAVTGVLVLRMVRRKKGFSLSPKDFSFKVLLRILSLGMPMAAGLLLSSVSSLFSNRLLVQYGNLAVAAQNVAGKAGMLTGMLLMGICMGLQPAVSYTFGRGDRRRMRSLMRGTGLAVTLIGAVLAVGLILARDSFVGAFLRDAAVLELGGEMLVAGVAAAPLSGIYQLCSTYLQATGKVSYATVTSLMEKGLVLVPVLAAMNALLGLPGLVWAGAVTTGISTAAAVFLSLRWARQQRRETVAAPPRQLAA